LAYANPEARCVAYEINEYSAIITKILYPFCDVRLAPFESVFISKKNTIRGKVENLEKFDIVIGNCPYGSFDALDTEANTNAARLLLGFGEKDFTNARNYVEYFLRRGMDLLKPGGLMVMIIGAELKNGGAMFLDGGVTPVKKYLNDNCKLLEAYRLPDTTFERTGVTSDIIVLKKNGGEKEEERFIAEMPEAKTVEAPESKKEVSNGERNRLFLSKLTDEDSDLILTAVAKYYGKENDTDYKREMYEELVDDEAEDIMDYLKGETRNYFYPMWKRINQIN
jgi:type I restriction-modification system DNA methylase subunit